MDEIVFYSGQVSDANVTAIFNSYGVGSNLGLVCDDVLIYWDHDEDASMITGNIMCQCVHQWMAVGIVHVQQRAGVVLCWSTGI